MYKGWAFSALAPRPTVDYCAYFCSKKRIFVLTEENICAHRMDISAQRRGHLCTQNGYFCSKKRTLVHTEWIFLLKEEYCDMDGATGGGG
jgi:hypothetical protein